jgi:hypothetical protein
MTYGGLFDKLVVALFGTYTLAWNQTDGGNYGASCSNDNVSASGAQQQRDFDGAVIDYGAYLANIYAPGLRRITGMDTALLGQSSTITCAHCGRTFAARPVVGCPGCAGHEYR